MTNFIRRLFKIEHKEESEKKKLRHNLFTHPGLASESDIKEAYGLGVINEREYHRLREKQISKR
jgi:hypothetical protein